jgi:hypothetical protein
MDGIADEEQAKGMHGWMVKKNAVGCGHLLECS